jgi:carbon-monoxide dehydrogenase large subunit
MHQGGTALLLAVEGLIENARWLAARLLQTSADAVHYEAGMLRVTATGQEISLDEVARASFQVTNEEIASGLAHRATHSATLHVSQRVPPRRGGDRSCDRWSDAGRLRYFR